MKTFFAVCRRYWISMFPSFSHPHYNVNNAVDRNNFYNIHWGGDYNN